MSKFEERAQNLRAAVVDIVEGADAEAFYDRLGTHRRRRRAMAVAVTAAAAAIVTAVVVLPQLPSPPVLIQPADPTGEPSDGATSDGRGGATDADAFAVLEDRQGVVALDLDSGEVTEEVEAADSGEGLGDVAYSRARDSLLISRVMTACRTEIVEVPLNGGEERVLGVGSEAAVASDGTRYAIARGVSEACGEPSSSIEVGTFAGGAHHTWTTPAEVEGPYFVGDLTWSADDRHLAFALHFGDGTEVRLLDTSDTSSERLEAASRELQAPLERPVAWSAPAYRGEALTVVEGPALGYEDEVSTWRVREVDPETGEPTQTLLETRRAVVDLDWAVGGRQLLYIESHVDHDRTDAQPPTLFRWVDGRSEEVRDAVRAVSWGAAPTSPSSAGEQPDNEPSARARTLCETVGLQFATGYGDSTLRESVDTRVGTFNAWTRDRAGKDGPIPVDDAVDGPSEAFMALCWYEGVYPSIPRGPAADADPYTWIAITVKEDGTADLFEAVSDGDGDFRPQGNMNIPPREQR